MNILQNSDITFVLNWQRGYNSRCSLTGVDLPPNGPLTKTFYDAFFPALDLKIKTPVAFACLAPFGWNGERCDWDYKIMGDYGWKPVFWRESTHIDKTFVQFYMRLLDRPDASERPKAAVGNARIAYSGSAVGQLPYLGCSSILSAYETPKMKVELPKPKMFKPCWEKPEISAEGKALFYPNGVPFDKCLHFVRVARPAAISTLKLLKTEGFKRLVALRFNSYWIRGKEGLGSRELCEY